MNGFFVTNELDKYDEAIKQGMVGVLCSNEELAHEIIEAMTAAKSKQSNPEVTEYVDNLRTLIRDLNEKFINLEVALDDIDEELDHLEVALADEDSEACDCEACCGIDLDEGVYCSTCGELWEDCDCCLSGEDDDRGYGDSVWRGWIK